MTVKIEDCAPVNLEHGAATFDPALNAWRLCGHGGCRGQTECDDLGAGNGSSGPSGFVERDAIGTW
jgi:hypothetical protein